MLGVALELYMTGLALGLSTCLVCTAPLLGLYIGGTGKGWKEGLRAFFVFSLARLFGCTLLGCLAGIVKGLVISLVETYYIVGAVLWGMAGLFLCLMGGTLIYGKEPRIPLLQLLRSHLVKSSHYGLAGLGVIVGISISCPVAVGAFTYIVFNVNSWLLGAFYGFSFGLGVVSSMPLLAIGISAGAIAKALKNPKTHGIFKKVCAGLLLVFGVQLLVGAFQSIAR